MPNKSISFNEEMLKAILDGRKTQTRRLHAEPKYKAGDVVRISNTGFYLQITRVKKEKLQDITEQDAKKEGLIMLPASCRFVINKGDQYFGGAFHDYAECFAFLWDSIYKEDESKQWKANPWVWVYEFERV